MTLFFDIHKLEQECKGSDILFISILEDFYCNQKYNKLQKLKYKSIKGRSWLLNPLPLFDKTIADVSYRVQYIKLAGRRNYSLYIQHNIIFLDISFYPNLNILLIKDNPLLNIINNNIHFKFEDKYLETKLNKEKLNGT
jgi:hypothetical protein